MKKWEVLSKSKFQSPKTAKLLQVLLRNRHIKPSEEKDFLNPKLSKVTVKSVGIDKNELKKAVLRIKQAIKNKEQIIVFGDYDVDGISGSAILWETLSSVNAKILPYIPHRVDEGYGLSVKGIENLLSKVPDVKLIITVDNGIVADDAVAYANAKGIDVIITDHHVPSNTRPQAYSIVHTTRLCGAGVAYILSQEFNPKDDYLELVALATIADLVPLIGSSRTLTKFGLENLRQTKRIGFLELFREAGLDKNSIGTYEVGHVIGPRLNAMGRLESAMDSLRLLCTRNPERAKELARKLSSTNLQRQNITQKTVFDAIAHVKVQKTELSRILFVADKNYQQGVIGLVAGKLVEQYYLPSIVVSKGEIYSKASARSISGFNIIEFIRSASEFLVDAGGHPMAAGFTVETAKIELVQKKLEELALKQITKKMLTQVLRIDCRLPVQFITNNLYDAIQQLAPFGMGNPIPVFTDKATVEDLRTVGQDNKHLKLRLGGLNAIGFNLGGLASKIKIGKRIEFAYTIDQDSWNGNKRLQLKIKDIKI